MQDKDSCDSASTKIKYYEALSKGSCVAEQKFSSKAYTPTPFSSVKTPTPIPRKMIRCIDSSISNAHATQPHVQEASTTVTEMKHGPNHIDEIGVVVLDSNKDPVTIEMNAVYPESGPDEVQEHTEKSLKPTKDEPLSLHGTEVEGSIGDGSEPTEIDHEKEVLPTPSEENEFKQCERKTTLPVQDVRDFIHNEKAFEEHVGRKEIFEEKLEKREKEVETQLRDLWNALKSIQAETEEIEKIVSNFAQTIAACTKIIHKACEADVTHTSETSEEKANFKITVAENKCIDQEFRECLQHEIEVQKRRFDAIKDLQEDIEEMKVATSILMLDSKILTSERMIVMAENAVCVKRNVITQIQTLVTGAKSTMGPCDAMLNFASRQSNDTNIDSYNIKCEKDYKSKKCIDEPTGTKEDINFAFSTTSSEAVCHKTRDLRNSEMLGTKQNIEKQKSAEDLVSPCCTGKRKTKIPKPMKQSYKSAPRVKIISKSSLDLSESVDHNHTRTVLSCTKEKMVHCEKTFRDSSPKVKQVKQVKAKIDTGLKSKATNKSKLSMNDLIESDNECLYETEALEKSFRKSVHSSSKIPLKIIL